jgi:hypothetical protein
MVTKTSTEVKPIMIEGIPWLFGFQDGYQGLSATYGYMYFWGKKLRQYESGHAAGLRLRAARQQATEAARLRRVEERVLGAVRETLQPVGGVA